ncbi:KICSTOR complex protein C12orf66-like [Rhopalosiphum maidis]|uniref:KICSTOR complex protein C12orf66-like n=1 Tax=Rhopalosiphum maidis TaxID=43146 RepID=UPI000EFFA6DE|nr:KICSTOR complex protein C12orf66-like [Rhopalosiphum maidis]
MPKSQEEIVRLFFNYLSKSNYDEAKEFMERQRLVFLNNAWPKAMFDILCDFALAEKNYYDTNFEPSKNKMLERKEDENYLDFVYKTLYQDLEKLQTEVDDNYVIKLMTTLLQFISVRLQLLELYDKLYEIGSLNSWINFSELSETVENIQNDLSNFSPVDQVLRIVRYELDCIQHLFKCHEHLGEWSYFDSLISLKESSDAFILWEKCYQNKEAWRFGSLFMSKSTLPPLLLWFKRFKHMTISKFMLYFYGILVRQSSLREVKNTSETKNLHFFTKMQQLKQKAEALSAMLVFESPDYVTDDDSSNESQSIIKMDPYIKYKIIISYPKVPVKFDVVEKMKINEEEHSVNKIEMITDENVTYMIMRVDLKILFIMCFNGKPKNEEREKASTLEFVSMLRCHKYFTSVNR